MPGILEQIAGISKEFEKQTGAPPLSKLVETINKLPDEKRLKLIKELLDTAERVSRSAADLAQVIELIREINAMPMDKLKELDKVLRRIDSIIKNAPQDLLSFLASLKEK